MKAFLLTMLFVVFAALCLGGVNGGFILLGLKDDLAKTGGIISVIWSAWLFVYGSGLFLEHFMKALKENRS